MQPKFATIPVWCQLSGMSRSRCYIALNAGSLRAVKCGKRTLIDVDAGLDWLRAQASYKAAA